MAFVNTPHYAHGAPEKIGILLANLGSPNAPTTTALQRYLLQFLSDPRVIETPRWQWLPILFGIVLPFRSPRSAAAYQKIWTKDGSPLIINCHKQRDKIIEKLNDQPIAVAMGMSYGKPRLRDALHQLKAQNCRRLLILPLYPQYSGSTTGSVFNDITAELSRWRAVPHFRFVAAYCDNPRYVNVLADSILQHQQQHGKPDKLIFSFHGTPRQMLDKGDPYHCLCHKTARLVAEHLRLDYQQWQVTFQSRFGRGEWLRPYTDAAMQTMPSSGVKNIQVICPAFSSDCLETLEEIAQENRDIFLKAGGDTFSYIPALNDSESHIDFLHQLIMDNISDWLAHLKTQNDPADRDLQKQKADFVKFSTKQ